jgi:hypothetical protein
MPTAVVRGAGRCFGRPPAAKVSMMIMRPPQQRQGRGSTRGLSVAAVVDVSAGFAVPTRGENRAPPSGSLRKINNVCQIKSKLLQENHQTRRL